MLPLSTESLQGLLDVEVALAGAEADADVIPASCVKEIQAVADAQRYDLTAITAEAASAGNIVIPLVSRLRAAVAARSPAAAQFVHYGATSQDILDTALVIHLRATIRRIDEPLGRTMHGAATLARMHVSTPMAGRTWLQQASPTTFGLKAAGWLDLIGRVRERLQQAAQRALVVQLGGASGTLASLGADARRVIDAFARRLDLDVPDMPWHTQRDRIADVAAALGLTCGALGKVGRDVALLAQTEVGEVRERLSSGEGTSTAMPHKQNPVRAITAIAASVRAPQLVAVMLAAMPQEHERAAGGWQAEWTTMPDLLHLTAASSDAIADALAGLEVDAERMRANLLAYGGFAMSEALVVAMSAHMSRPEAAAIVERWSRGGSGRKQTLRQAAAADPDIQRHLSLEQIESALSPEHYLGNAAEFVSRVLQRWGV
jgi:3-carboxy-cis,cis-muconate cycloisomerase